MHELAAAGWRPIVADGMHPRAADSPIAGPDTAKEGADDAPRNWPFYCPRGAGQRRYATA